MNNEQSSQNSGRGSKRLWGIIIAIGVLAALVWQFFLMPARSANDMARMVVSRATVEETKSIFLSRALRDSNFLSSISDSPSGRELSTAQIIKIVREEIAEGTVITKFGLQLLPTKVSDPILNDRWDRPIHVCVTSNRPFNTGKVSIDAHFAIWSDGPNKIDDRGTTDDITSWAEKEIKTGSSAEVASNPNPDTSTGQTAPVAIELPSGRVPDRQAEEFLSGNGPARLHWRFTDLWSLTVSETNSWIDYNGGIGGSHWEALTDLEILQFWRICDKFQEWDGKARHQQPESFEKQLPLDEALSSRGIQQPATIQATFKWKSDDKQAWLSIHRKADIIRTGVMLRADDIESMRILLGAIPEARRQLSSRAGEQQRRAKTIDSQFR